MQKDKVALSCDKVDVESDGSDCRSEEYYTERVTMDGISTSMTKKKRKNCYFVIHCGMINY